MKQLITIAILLINLNTFSNSALPKIEPPFWWTGMNDSNLQLMIYAKNIAIYQPTITYPGVKILKINKVENVNYLFVDLSISPKTKAGSFFIEFKNGNKTITKYHYFLKQRKSDSAFRKGFDNKDIIYLLMPDRFSNGNPENDNVSGLLEEANRTNPDGRHGGDIQGIINHLEYFKQIGVTALWINPLLENNMPKYSYHGYAITDFYKVDSRFGSNQDYEKLTLEAHAKGLKIIQDMVFNHCASGHWWINDLPSKDWIHQFNEFTRSNYRSETIMDPYAADSDKKLMSDGWFDQSMPDLNQKNKFLAKYLIQNSIWWIEFADIDGIRMDTYPYSDQEFMNNWVGSVMKEYPNFNIVGETWLQTEAHTAFFQANTFTNKKPLSSLHSITDFPLCYAINGAINQGDSWTEGMAKIYITLSKDFLYSCPDSNLIFLDNHDMSRFSSNINEDFDKWKMGIGFLLTTRGIPMIYYGTEIMLEGKKESGDGKLREDFPGGWPSDSISAFTSKNISDRQKEALAYISFLMKYRNENSALQNGKLKHYIPEDGVYTYFRFNDNSNFMIMMNNNSESKSIDVQRFKESTLNYSTGTDIFTSEEFLLNQKILLPAKSISIFKLK